MSQYIEREPDSRIRQQDLKVLAKYLIKVGTDTSLVFRYDRLWSRIELPEEATDPIDVPLTRQLVKKYGLEYQTREYNVNYMEPQVRSLDHLANNLPKDFIVEAGLHTPGNYDQRRFWWCAGNWDFYKRYGSTQKARQLASGAHQSQSGLCINLSSSRLLSDVICQVLELCDKKLITVAALHRSVRYSNHRTQMDWFKKNLCWVKQQIHINLLDHHRPYEREHLRKVLFIREAERELEHINVSLFIEWWNHTGLERVGGQVIEQLKAQQQQQGE